MPFYQLYFYNNTKFRAEIVTLFITVLFLGCKIHTHADTDPKYIPKIHLNVNEQYYYNISSEINTKLELNEKEVDNIKQSTIGLLYETLKDSADQFLIKITYDSLHILTKKGDVQTEMDAANVSEFSNPLEKILGIIKGNSLFVTLTKKGQIVSVNGYNELIDKIVEGVKFNNEDEKKQVQLQLSNLLGEKFLQTDFQDGFGLLPNSAVFVGDSWEKKETQSTEFKLNSNTTYTLESVKDSIVEIDASTEMESTDSSFEIMGTNVDADLKGEQDGIFDIDLRTGLLIYQKTNASIKGNIKLLDREVPITIKIKKEISSKKL
jgi:hypothetical protein